MATDKITTLAFRIEPELKEALRTAAQNEHRSIANMVEVLIRDYCEQNGIAIPEQGAFFDEVSIEAPAGKRGRNRDGNAEDHE